MGVNMSKRMIDADALLKQIKNQYNTFAYHEKIFNDELENIKKDTIEKIIYTFKKCLIPKQKFFIGQEVLYFHEFASSRGKIESCEYKKQQEFIAVWTEIGKWVYKINGKLIHEEKIKELATPVPEPQESIFDAEGWCWDMDSLHDNGDVLLYVINPDLKTKRATVGKKIDKNFYFARVSERDRPNAWKPLPTLPKDKP